MNKRQKLLNAAICGIAMGAAALSSIPSLAHGEEKMDTEKCWGVNSCKNHNACGVGKSDIEATKAVFKARFAKSATHDCANMNNCSAKKGNLEWVPVGKGHCLNIEAGFLIEEKGGKKVVTSKK